MRCSFFYVFVCFLKKKNLRVSGQARAIKKIIGLGRVKRNLNGPDPGLANEFTCILEVKITA